jgi:hypothetical protein
MTDWMGGAAGGSVADKTEASSTAEFGTDVWGSEAVWGSMKDAKAESAAEDACGALPVASGTVGSVDAKKAVSEAEDV